MTMRVRIGSRPTSWRAITAASIAALLTAKASGQQVPILGETYAHDPSAVMNDDGTYYYFSTGQGILSRSSTDLQTWSDGPDVFPDSPPSWTTSAVPGFTGDFWAPDLSYFDGLYHVYYAVSTFGSQVSAIGMATSPTLNPSGAGYGWTDSGAPIIESTNGSAYNAIDPSVMTAADGTMWMTFGSYWDGIYEVQINPTTGTVLNPSSAPIHLAQRAGSDTSLEASYLYYRDGYYYLFENWGACCEGVNSTYNVRIGRSTSPNGPFVDESGASLLNGGGSLFLATSGNYIGPGQVGILSQSGQDYVSYHYYNGANSGTPAFALQDLYWTSDGWPTTIQPLIWNATGTGTTPQDGSGGWNLSAPTFFNGTANQKWNNSGYGGVTFGAGNGAAGTITLEQNITAAAITFAPASSGNYTLAGSGYTLTLTLGSGTGGTITTNAFATISVPVDATTSLTKLGSSVLTFGTGSTVSSPEFFVRAGTVAMTGSAAVTTAASPASSANNYSSIGQMAGDVGSLTISGDASYTVAGDLNIGDVSATGTLRLSGSGVVAARTLYVGKYGTSDGEVIQTGGTVEEADNGAAADEWRIGGGGSSSDAGAIGVYEIYAGTLNSGYANLQVGAYGQGTLTQTGGSVIAGGYLSIGRFAGGVGTVDLSSGNGTLTANAEPFLIVGEQGTGTLKVGGSSVVNADTLAVGFNAGQGSVIETGGTVNAPGGVLLGNVAGGSGSYDLAGGTLNTASVSLGSGAGTIRFNGGTLQATTSSTTFLQGLTSAVVSNDGGAVIDSAGYSITIAQALQHDSTLSGADGGLTFMGGTSAGSLVLSGANTYTGVTTVNGGSLVLDTHAQAPVLGSGGANVEAGELVFNYNGGSDPVALVRSDLAASYNGAGGAFTGGQIYSSTAVADRYGLGYVDNPSSDEVTVMYTLYGDTNLDGSVNFADLLTVAQYYGDSNTDWAEGDFNYDGSTNFSDLLLLAQNYDQSLSSSQTVELDQIDLGFVQQWDLALQEAAVPEPGAVGLLAIGAGALGMRRRRWRARSEPQAISL